MDPRYRRVIHILRDPRDVAGSYYHYTHNEFWHYFKKPAVQPAFEDFIEHFLEGNIWPCSWELHTRTFTGMTDNTSRHRVIYERLLENPTEEIDSLLQFIGLKLDNASLIRLAEHASFKNMNKLFNLNEVRNATGFSRRDKILKTGRAGGHYSLYDESTLARMEPLCRLYHDQTT